MKQSHSPNGTVSRKLAFYAFLFIICSQTYLGFGQTVIRNYLTGAVNMKNYSIIETPGSSGGEFLMAGTVFGNLSATPQFQGGEAIHFMRVDNVGALQWGGTYSVSVRYDFPMYQDVRCVDIVSYTSSKTIIVIEARLVQSQTDYLQNKDVIVVLTVNNLDGTIVSTKELSSPREDWLYGSVYATHAIYHEDKYDGNHYLYICGYDGIQTSYPFHPDYIPHYGPAYYDKRILVLKYDMASTTVLAARTWDYPWPMWVADQSGLVYDFDIAMRMVPIDDGSGDIYVTGSTNSDYSLRTSGPHPINTDSYGGATLSLRIQETHSAPGVVPLKTVALRPFIENPYTSYDEAGAIPFYEHGYGAYEESPGGSTGGLFVFSNEFSPVDASGGIWEQGHFHSDAQSIRMTYIDKATLNFTPVPTTNNHRMKFSTVDWNWGTQVLRSSNGAGNLYLAGLQTGWDQGGCGAPNGGNAFPSTTNVNPFIAELTPVWSGTSVAASGINFWTTYFSLNGTGAFNELGGALSYTLWSNEFVADNASNINNIVFTAPRWDANNARLNLKLTRTDQNGNLNITGNDACDDSYQSCIRPTDLPQIADAWVYGNAIEATPTISDREVQNPELTILAVLPATCADFSLYKPAGVTSLNDDFENVEYAIYPNPTDEYINVKISGYVSETVPVKVTLYNILMQSVIELYNGDVGSLVNSKMKIPDVQAGLYILKISSGERTLHMEKLSID